MDAGTSVVDTVIENTPTTGIYTQQISQALQYLSTTDALLIILAIELAIIIGLFFVHEFYAGLK